MWVPRSKRSRLTVLVVIAVAAALAAVSPSYTHVSIKGGGQDVEVNRAGFGPQRVRVQTGDMHIESSAR